MPCSHCGLAVACDEAGPPCRCLEMADPESVRDPIRDAYRAGLEEGEKVGFARGECHGLGLATGNAHRQGQEEMREEIRAMVCKAFCKREVSFKYGAGNIEHIRLCCDIERLGQETTDGG